MVRQPVRVLSTAAYEYRTAAHPDYIIQVTWLPAPAGLEPSVELQVDDELIVPVAMRRMDWPMGWLVFGPCSSGLVGVSVYFCMRFANCSPLACSFSTNRGIVPVYRTARRERRWSARKTART